VKPPIKDTLKEDRPPNKGQARNTVKPPIKDTLKEDRPHNKRHARNTAKPLIEDTLKEDRLEIHSERGQTSQQRTEINLQPRSKVG
jgi:hypothetical protein